MEPPNTAMPPGAEIHYAGFRRRVWASLIDDLFLIVPTLAILTLTGFDMMSDEIGHGPDATDHGADGIGDFGHGAELSTTTITAAFWWLYYALMESSRRQASLGKLVMRLKVTDMAGRRVSFAAATLRAWPFYLFGLAAIVDYAFGSYALGGGLFSIVGTILAFVACVAVAFTARKQGIHDIMAGCLVVR